VGGWQNPFAEVRLEVAPKRCEVPTAPLWPGQNANHTIIVEIVHLADVVRARRALLARRQLSVKVVETDARTYLATLECLVRLSGIIAATAPWRRDASASAVCDGFYRIAADGYEAALGKIGSAFEARSDAWVAEVVDRLVSETLLKGVWSARYAAADITPSIELLAPTDTWAFLRDPAVAAEFAHADVPDALEDLCDALLSRIVYVGSCAIVVGYALRAAEVALDVWRALDVRWKRAGGVISAGFRESARIPSQRLVRSVFVSPHPRPHWR
jgi:hypothetical protein